jgi:hypothetical protein
MRKFKVLPVILVLAAVSFGVDRAQAEGTLNITRKPRHHHHYPDPVADPDTAADPTPTQNDPAQPDPTQTVDQNPWITLENQVIAKYPTLSHAALDYAFNYLVQNEASVTNKNYMTVIDFDLASTVERMYVIDLKNVTVSTYLVAHGKASGDNFATHFSNQPDSNMSSLGVYLTGNEYVGEHGVSMILNGMEATNNNALSRAIVFHGADYVSDDFIKQNGRLGRSLGCPAVSLQYSTQLVQQLEGGSILYIHHDPLQQLISL